MNKIKNAIFYIIDAPYNMKDAKSFRAVMFVYMLFAMMIGHSVVVIAKEYIPIAWHKIFKEEVMQVQPTTEINSDLPNEDMK